MANGSMWLVKGASDLMQRLTGLPSLPYISSSRGESLDRFLWVINTILKQQIFLDGVASTY